MKIKRIVIFEDQVVLVLNNKKQNIIKLKPYAVLGHGRGIHVPKREEISLSDIRDKYGDAACEKLKKIVKKRIEEFSRNKMVVHEYDHHLGYHGLYFEFPKTAARYNLLIDNNTEFVFNII